MEGPEGTEPRTARRCRPRKRRTFQERFATTVYQQFNRTAKKGEIKLTVGDVIRVMEWEQRRNGEEVDGVKVMWVEPKCEGSASEQ
jgi:protein involved in polysaccharide export with SLBB domain